jgi:hypothetical protein
MFCCQKAAPQTSVIRIDFIRIRTGNADPDPGAWKLTEKLCAFVCLFFDL